MRNKQKLQQRANRQGRVGKQRVNEAVIDQNIQDYGAKYFCIFKNDELLRVFKEYKEKLAEQREVVGESAGDFQDTPFFKFKSATSNGKPVVEAVWTGPSTAIEGGFSPKLRAVGVPEQLETGTTLIIDPARAGNGDIMDGVIGAKFTSSVEVDPSIAAGAVDNIEGDAVGSDIGAEGDAGGTWWGSGAGDAISWAVLLKWLSVGVAATALLVKTYPWWGQKVKYMVQKCKDGRSLAVMEFSTDDWGGEMGEDYRFRYDFKRGRWVLEYTSMSLLRAKTFPSPQEVEQFIGTSTCKKFVDRCTEVLYRVLDDEAFEGFVEFLQSKDKASYKLCKQLIDNKESLHRTFETMKVKYL